MARPCKTQHDLSPSTCPYCAWCVLPGPAADAMREQWQEPGPPIGDRRPIAGKANRSCEEARASMTAEEMAALISAAPPGPWPEDWAKWDCTRDAHLILQAKKIAATSSYPGGFAGRGIVICVNAKPGHSSGKYLEQGYFPGAWVAVKELRRHGCNLPITFAYLGDLEWDYQLTDLMSNYGVECIDLREVAEMDTDKPRILNGWESKWYAVSRCRYEDVLYLDADNIPLRDPTFLFDSSQYKYYGSVFWADVPPYDRQEWLPACVWANVGLSYRDEVDFETGQFVINKRSCWAELELSGWINSHSDYFYRFVFGDKSTFHLAWAVLGRNWAIPQKGPGGNQASLLQHDFAGDHLFQHCTRNKPTLAGYPSPGSLIHESHCLEHLAHLRNIRVAPLWEQTDPNAEEAELLAHLVGRVYTYRRIGIDSRAVRLLEDGRIGRGLAKLEVGWSVWSRAGQVKLVITSIDGVPTASLRPAPDGVWRGYWLEHERCAVELVPIEEG